MLQAVERAAVINFRRCLRKFCSKPLTDIFFGEARRDTEEIRRDILANRLGFLLWLLFGSVVFEEVDYSKIVDIIDHGFEIKKAQARV